MPAAARHHLAAAQLVSAHARRTMNPFSSTRCVALHRIAMCNAMASQQNPLNVRTFRICTHSAGHQIRPSARATACAPCMPCCMRIVNLAAVHHHVPLQHVPRVLSVHEYIILTVRFNTRRHHHPLRHDDCVHHRAIGASCFCNLQMNSADVLDASGSNLTE